MVILGVNYAEASLVAPIFYFQMIWAAVSGVFLFGEALTPVLIIGAAVIVLAGLIVQRGESWGKRPMTIRER